MLEREEIYERVWGYAMARGDRSVDVFVRKLRQKLERASPAVDVHPHALRRRLSLRAGAGRGGEPSSRRRRSPTRSMPRPSVRRGDRRAHGRLTASAANGHRSDPQRRDHRGPRGDRRVRARPATSRRRSSARSSGSRSRSCSHSSGCASTRCSAAESTASATAGAASSTGRSGWPCSRWQRGASSSILAAGTLGFIVMIVAAGSGLYFVWQRHRAYRL